MENESDDQQFFTERWSIENFSCWNSKIHGVAIMHRNVIVDNLNFRLELYPKGLDGKGEHFVVRIYDENRSNGELSFLSQDGSDLCKVEITDPEWNDCAVVLFTHLKFQEVVERIVKDPFHKDVFTLKYRKKKCFDAVFRVYNKIDVIDSTIDMPIARSNSLPWTDTCSSIMNFLMDGKLTTFQFIASIALSDNMELRLNFKLTNISKSVDISNYVFMRSCLYLLNNDGDLLVSEEKQHSFLLLKRWTFAFVVPGYEGTKKGLSLLMRLKIITGKKTENYRSFWFQPQQISVSKSDEFRCCEETSLESEHYNLENVQTILDILSVKEPFKDTDTNQSEKSINGLGNKEPTSLYLEQDFPDCQLRCGNATFPVHKDILSSRSPVFKSLLSADEDTSYLDIVDMDGDTLSDFVAFLYNGTMDHQQWEGAFKLYCASEKYQVPSLKMDCTDVLIAKLSPSNVCAILSLADKNHDERLAAAAQDFISENNENVLESNAFLHYLLAL